MIPKILHFIWTGPPLPQWCSKNLERWRKLNPEYDVRLHGEEVLREEWRDLYRRTSDLCSRSDLLRLSVLREFGGWYFDMDFVPLRPMRELCAKYDLSNGCLLTKQWCTGPKRIANGVIGIAPAADAWEEIDNQIKKAWLAPLERTTFGPLLATSVVERCPGIEVGETKDFYLWRFGPKDTGGTTESQRKYEVLLAGDFDEASISATCGEHRPFVVHLWMGGDYGWTPGASSLKLTPLKGEPTPIKQRLCPGCQGRGCAACRQSGFTINPNHRPMPPRDDVEQFFKSYGWEVSCWQDRKIVFLPTHTGAD